MPDIGTVGAISLDLTIRDKVVGQIERIVSAARRPAEELGKELEKAFNTPMKSVGSTAEESLSAPMKKAAENAAKAVDKKMSELAEDIRTKLGALEFPTETAEKFAEQLGTLTDKLSLMQKLWQELSSADPLSSAASNAEKLEKSVAALEKRLSEINIKAPKADISDELLPKVKTTAAASGSGLGAADIISGLGGGVSGIAGLIGTAASGNPAIGAAVGSVTSTVTGTVSKAFGTVGKLINKLTANSAAKLKNLASELLDITKPLKKIGSFLTRAFKSVFIAAGVYSAFRALKDGILEAANADERFSESLKTVKANLAIAFTPIVMRVMPMLNTLMEGLARTSKQLAGFMAGLFGMTYEQAANATKKLREAADAAKRAKLAVAGIDELNILSDGSEDSSEIDFSKLDMTEPKLPDWAERLKNSIREGDWKGAGAALADKVNSVLRSIDWEKIESKFKEKSKNLADLINGFVDEIDPDALGAAAAGVINTITGTVTSFVDNVRWGNIGTKLAKSLNTAVKNIKWEQVGRTLTSGLRILTDIIYGFSENFDFRRLGDGLGRTFNSAVRSIDTQKLGTGISNVIKGAITVGISFLTTADFAAVGAKLAGFFSNIDVRGITSGLGTLLWKAVCGALDLMHELFAGTDFYKLGLDLTGGVLDSIDGVSDDIARGSDDLLMKLAIVIYDSFKAGLKLAGGMVAGTNLIYLYIAKPFMDKLREGLGIKGSGNSSEGKSIGKKLLEGMADGVSERISKVRDKFDELRGKIEEAFEDTDTWFGKKFGDARDTVESKFSSIGTWFGDRWTDIKEIFSDVETWFRDTFQGAWDKVKSVFSAEHVAVFFGQTIGTVKSSFSDIGTWIKEKFQTAYDNVTEVWEQLPQFFWDTWGRIYEGATNGLNNVLGVVESFVNRTINAFNAVARIKIKGVSLFEGVDNITIPRLASGGLATAPTLAMVGDNPNARTDPEAILPVSKLQAMLDQGSGNAEIIELLRLIVEMLKSGISAELIGSLFGNDFKRTVLRIVSEDNARRG